EHLFGECELVVGRRVHEVVMRAVAIHELDVAVIQARTLKAIARLERLLYKVAFADVAQLHAHLRAATAELDVLELDDLVQHAVDLDGHPALDLPGADHAFFVSSMSQRRATSYPATPFPTTWCSVTSVRKLLRRNSSRVAMSLMCTSTTENGQSATASRSTIEVCASPPGLMMAPAASRCCCRKSMSAPSWLDWNATRSAPASRAISRQRASTSFSVVRP